MCAPFLVSALMFIFSFAISHNQGFQKTPVTTKCTCTLGCEYVAFYGCKALSDSAVPPVVCNVISSAACNYLCSNYGCPNKN